MWRSNWQEMVRPAHLSVTSGRRALSLAPRSSLSHCAERGGRNCEMRVDFHTHYIPKHFPDMAEKYGDPGWPTLLHTGPCQAEIFNAGTHYRSIDDRSWEPERRIKDMDAEGVDMQVLSPLPVTFAYHFS